MIGTRKKISESTADQADHDSSNNAGHGKSDHTRIQECHEIMAPLRPGITQTDDVVGQVRKNVFARMLEDAPSSSELAELIVSRTQEITTAISVEQNMPVVKSACADRLIGNPLR